MLGVFWRNANDIMSIFVRISKHKELGLSQSCINTYILCDLNDNASFRKHVHLRALLHYMTASNYAFVIDESDDFDFSLSNYSNPPLGGDSHASMPVKWHLLLRITSLYSHLRSFLGSFRDRDRGARIFHLDNPFKTSTKNR